MIDQKQLNLISRIYDSVISNEKWPSLLQDCAKDVGAKSCIIASANVISPDEFTITAYSSHFSRDIIRDYEENYAHYDQKAWGRLQFMPSGTMLPDEEIWPDQKAEEIFPYMQWCEQTLGINKRVGYRLNDDLAWFEAAAFQFNLAPDKMTDYDTVRSRIFLPHFAKSVTLMRSFNVLKQRFNAVLAALDHFHIALIMTKGNGQIVHSNRAAERILDDANGIDKSPDGFLRIAHPDLNEKAKTAIADASNTAKGHDTFAHCTLKVPKKDGENGYLMEISPLRDTDKEIDSTFKDSLIMIIDPANVPVFSMQGIAPFFDLTKTEAAVTELTMQGATTQEIAEHRNVSPETIKSQIKSILAKTNCRNRIELVRTVLNVHLPIDKSNS